MFVKQNGLDRSHIHVVHVCGSSTKRNRTCWCGGLACWVPPGYGLKRKFIRRTPEGYGRKALLYLSSQQRRVQEIVFEGISTAYGREVCDNDSQEMDWDESACEERHDSTIDGSEFPGIECSFYNEQGAITLGSEEDDGSVDGETSTKKAKLSNRVLQGQKLTALITQWQPGAMSATRTIPVFRDLFPDLFYNMRYFKDAIEPAWLDAVDMWNRLSLKDILAKQMASMEKFLNNTVYYDTETSGYLIARLILDQCHNDFSLATCFCQNLFDVADKKISKINTFLLVSPPSSGKTYLINSFTGLFWTVGQIRNPVKGGGDFTYADARNCRLATWNECIITGETFINQAKEVWEGNPTAANVKCRDAEIIYRTPIIVTANRDPWCLVKHNVDKEALRQRCFRYEWLPQTWLKFMTFYPHPLGWDIIYDNYVNLSFWELIQNRYTHEYFHSIDSCISQEESLKDSKYLFFLELKNWMNAQNKLVEFDFFAQKLQHTYI